MCDELPSITLLIVCSIVFVPWFLIGLGFDVFIDLAYKLFQTGSNINSTNHGRY